MDLERIKQNFRLRSGRSRKQKRQPKPQGNPLRPHEPTQRPSDLPNATSSRPRPSSAPNKDINDKEASEPKATPRNEAIEKDLREEKTSTETSVKPSPPPKEPAQVDEQAKEEEGLVEKPNSALGHQQKIPVDGPSILTPPRSRTHSSGSEGSRNRLEAAGQSHTMPGPHASKDPTSSEAEDFDLAPPKPRTKPPSIETLAELLLSSDHLDVLVHHPSQLSRFSGFLQRYLPQTYPQLTQYLETRKAIKAVEYANALAEGLRAKKASGEDSQTITTCAAKLDPEFEAICSSSFDALIGEALPSFVSYTLVKTASECLTNEITGRSTPIMREIVDGLSEVFCLADPNQEDTPIIYASEEFYRLTRYGPEDVLGQNCRFLQGRKTNPAGPKRIKKAIEQGQEISEVLLNYRRDGRPFLNLLMVAPLHDKNGKLKYQIGAQVDVTGLVIGGRALDSFQRLLHRRMEDKKRQAMGKAEQDLDDDQKRKRKSLARLRDLSEAFDLEESAVVQATSRSNSRTREEDEVGSTTSLDRSRAQRRVYVNSDASQYGDEEAVEDGKDDATDWTLGDAGNGKLSGKLPGVYDSFILFRPGPSFRVVFVSPKLRKIMNIVQSPFLSHVAAPNSVLNGLSESLRIGVPVSAKIHFTPERGERRDGTRLKNGTKHEDGKNGRAVWVSCTPLLGEDDRIGVWMCVVVEKSKVGSMNMAYDAETQSVSKTEGIAPSEKRVVSGESNASSARREDIPIKPVRLDSKTIIKPVETPKDSTEHRQEQSSKTVRPQQSIYFDAEQGNDNEQEEAANNLELNEGIEEEPDPDVDRQPSPEWLAVQERDPRAVITPVEEYAESEANHRPYSVGLPGITTSLEDRDEGTEEYITTRSPITPSRQNGRILIEEDSDVLQDSDLEHQRENMRIGRRRSGSESSDSLNSPASDIPPSIPSSAQMADENGDEDGDFTLDIETPTKTRHDRSPSPEAENDESPNQLGQSHVTIKPSRADSPKPPSDRDSAISLNSPAQPRKRSSPPRAESPRQQNPQDDDGSDYGNDEAKPDDEGPQKQRQEQEKEYQHEFDEEQQDRQQEELQPTPTREQDIETWVNEGRPPTSRHNSDKHNHKHEPTHDHDHEQHPQYHYHHHNHDSNHSHSHSDYNEAAHIDPPTHHLNSGVPMDYLRAGSSRWQRPPRQRLDVDFMDKDKDGFGHDRDPEDAMSFDLCANSPYSVD